jgi:hypothetical protein
MLSVIMLSVIMLSVIMLSVIVLSVIMLSVIKMNAFMLSVVAPDNKRKKFVSSFENTSQAFFLTCMQIF